MWPLFLLKVWLAVGAFPLLWDAAGWKIHGFKTLFKFCTIYTILGPFSWLFSYVMNGGT